MGYFFAIPKEIVKFVAIGAILTLTIANLWGLKYGKTIQNVFTLLKVLALVSIIFLGLVFLPREIHRGMVCPIFQQVPFSFSLIQSAGIALIFILWTYGGWTEAAYVAEKVKEPSKNMPRSILDGIFLVIFLYLLVNMVYYLYIPISEMRESKLVASIVVQKLVGSWGGKLVALFVAVSTFGALNGYILTGGRILYALAEDHALFHKLSAIHPKFHTPYLALLFNGMCSIILVLTKTFDQLMEYTTIVISIFFALTGLSVILLRKKFPEMNRPYRVWGYPWTPLIFAGSTLLFIVNAIQREPRESFFGILLVSLGFFLFLISQKMQKTAQKLFEKT